MRSCDPQEVPRLQSGGAFYAPRRIRTAPSWMPFFTHLQLGLLCRDERVARAVSYTHLTLPTKRIV